MTEVELQPAIEYSTELQDRALSAADRFLTSPEAANVKRAEFYSTNLESTISKALDTSSNTAFHVESGWAVGSANPDAKKTVISWFTLGEDKGDLPSGSIEIIEDGGEKQIYAYKADKPLVDDEGYLWGISRDFIDRTNDLSGADVQFLMSEEQVAQILARLEASQANKEQTEATAKWMDAEERQSEAIDAFQDLQRAGRIERWLKLPEARRRLTDASIKVRETEEEIKKKAKKTGEEETATSESTT